MGGRERHAAVRPKAEDHGLGRLGRLGSSVSEPPGGNRGAPWSGGVSAAR